MSCTASFKSVHQRSGSKHPKAESFLSWWFFSYCMRFASFIHFCMDPVFLGRLPSDSLKSPNLPLGHLALLVFRQHTVPSPGCCSCPVSLHIAILGTVLQQLQQQRRQDGNFGIPSSHTKNTIYMKIQDNLGFSFKSLKWLNPEILVFSPENSNNGESLQVIWNRHNPTRLHHPVVLPVNIWGSHAPCHHEAAAPFGIGM